MDRFTLMETFVEVAETEGFSAAARELRKSKSAVSKYISALEEQLGARLLNRTTRRLHLTEEGKAYYQRCKRILADVSEAEEAVSQMQGTPRGTLKINAPMSFGYRHLAPAVADFLQTYPEIEVDMTMNDRFVDVIDEGYDLAVRIGRLGDSSLVARKLAPARMALCGSPAYFKKHGRPQTPEGLKEHHCLRYAYAPSVDGWRFMGEDGVEKSIPVAGRFRVNNGDAMRELVLAGVGLAILPTFIIGPDLQTGALQTVLGDRLHPEPNIYAVYPENRHLSIKVRAFIDFLAARFGKSPYWDLVE